jgi:[amino group carrier protein]-lysine/ornithine hydrolase
MRPLVEDALRLLVDSLRVYSPSTKESALSLLLQDRMRHLGFRDVRTDRAGNAIGVVGGELGNGVPHLLLCGHMDTIPGMLEVREEDGRVYGRGAVDAKSAMCAMVSAASQFNAKDVRITVACVTREEGDSLGVNTLIEDEGAYDFAVFGEPGGAHKLAVGYRGRVEGKLRVLTTGGHAASPWMHPSAVDEALGVLARMKSYEKSHTVEGDHYKSVNISLTIITGGHYSNVIPPSCEATLDIRIPPGLTSSTVESELHQIVEDARKHSPDSRFELSFDEPSEPYDAPTDSLIVRAFQRSIIKTLASRPTLTHKTGTGDMNTMAQRMGVPCVTYGPGDSKLEHTDYEFVESSDYLNSIKVLTGAFRELAVLDSSRKD